VEVTAAGRTPRKVSRVATGARITQAANSPTGAIAAAEPEATVTLHRAETPEVLTLVEVEILTLTSPKAITTISFVTS